MPNIIDGYIFRVVARLGLAGDVPSLIAGEFGYDTDTKTLRVGDGTATPPRIPTTKSSGVFDFASISYMRVPELRLPPGGKVDGVDVSSLNSGNGFVVRRADGDFINRVMASGNGTISIVNGDGVNGDIDIRLSDSLIADLTPSRYFVSNDPPSDPRIGDFWHDADGSDNVAGNADDGPVYIRDTNGITEYWTQISNDYVNASETIVGVTRFATTAEALSRVLNTVALTPRSITTLIGAGNDFRAVINATLTTPPGSPSAKDAYLVPIGATGDWSSQVGTIATWNGSEWIYEQLRVGAFAVDASKAQSSGLRFLQQTAALTWATLNASESGPGIIEIATQAETNAGTDDTRSITPLKLKVFASTLTANSPFFPEVTTGGGHFSLAITPGQVVVSNGNYILWRGINLIKSEDYAIGDRTFTTTANSSYHLRWYAPGHARAIAITGNSNTGAFALESLGWVGYNPGGLTTLHPSFDSTYDSVLLASITTNGSNILTVGTWANRMSLSFQFDSTVYSNASPASFGISAENSINATITLPSFNWARMPLVRAHQATIGFGTLGGTVTQEPAISGAANNMAISTINRSYAIISGYTDYRQADGPFVLASSTIYIRASGSFYA